MCTCVHNVIEYADAAACMHMDVDKVKRHLTKTLVRLGWRWCYDMSTYAGNTSDTRKDKVRDVFAAVVYFHLFSFILCSFHQYFACTFVGLLLLCIGHIFRLFYVHF